MRIPKLILSAFAVGILMTAFISCEKNEYAQPDRNVMTEEATGSDRGGDTTTTCGNDKDGNCGGG